MTFTVFKHEDILRSNTTAPIFTFHYGVIVFDTFDLSVLTHAVIERFVSNTIVHALVYIGNVCE